MEPEARSTIMVHREQRKNSGNGLNTALLPRMSGRLCGLMVGDGVKSDV